jgi:cathepsin A (carboxypeptidase C)
MLSQILFAAFAATAAASSGFLEETSNSTICDSVKQYSGYYKLTTGAKNYFYWAFESRNSPSTDPVVLWMTGGPGCSSEVALFGENGPCKVNADGTDTLPNQYSWNNNATVIYIDQPSGTGFSWGSGMDHDEVGVANDMYDFLQQFMKAHPDLAKRDFYAFGESYAGHYIPAVTHKIWQNNNALPSGAIKINLKGTSVGNGLTDPEVQYQYYKDMAASTNDHSPLSNATIAGMTKATPGCIKAIQGCETGGSVACLAATESCNLGLLIPYTFTGMNPYDMRIKCAKPPLCYDFSNVATYLGRPDVQAAIGVDPKHKSWSDCNKLVTIGFELAGDWMKSYQQMIPDQLNAGIKVLIYAGDQDFICNWLGNQAWAQRLPWPHQGEFNTTKPVDWNVNGKKAGELQTSNGFSFLRVLDAGHMVPRDQPEHALAMLNAFIHGGI